MAFERPGSQPTRAHAMEPRTDPRLIAPGRSIPEKCWRAWPRATPEEDRDPEEPGEEGHQHPDSPPTPGEEVSSEGEEPEHP